MAGRRSALHAANQSSIVLLLFESYEGVLRLADRVLALLLEPDGRIILSYDWRQTNATTGVFDSEVDNIVTDIKDSVNGKIEADLDGVQGRPAGFVFLVGRKRSPRISLERRRVIGLRRKR